VVTHPGSASDVLWGVFFEVVDGQSRVSVVQEPSLLECVGQDAVCAAPVCQGFDGIGVSQVGVAVFVGGVPDQFE
jgi:hypothetical protein